MKKDYFIPKMFYRLLLPSVFSSLGYAFADIADSLVLGRSLGETGLAAIGLSLPLFMLINFVMDAFGIGGSVFFSQKLGEGDMEKAQNCFGSVWITTLIIGLTIGIGVNIFINPCMALLGTAPSDGAVYEACRDYVRIVALGAPLLMLNIVFANFLRNDNNAAAASVGFIVGNAVDIALNIVLVIFVGMGTRGAAIATVTGSLTAIVIYLPSLAGKYANAAKIKQFKYSLTETLYCFKTGFTTSITYLFQLVFFMVINRLLMNMAGESGVAVFDVVYSVSFFIIYVFNGVCDAMQPLTSTFYGENSLGDCRFLRRLALKSALIIGAVPALALALFAEPVSRLFGIPSDFTAVSALAVRIYCAGFVFMGFNVVFEKYYQSVSCLAISLTIVALRSFVLLIPFAMLFSRLGIKGVWLFYPVTELSAAAVTVLFSGTLKRREDTASQKQFYRVTIDKDGDIGKVLDECMSFCESHDADVRQKYAVTLVIEELCMSIIRNAMQSVNDGKIRITLIAAENGGFSLYVLDNAVLFNPFLIKDKKHHDDEFDIDEVSLTMIKNAAKSIMYRKCSGFNSLVVHI